MELTRRKSPGARIAAPWRMKKLRAEIEQTIATKVSHGLGPWWAAGAFTRHIAIGLFEPVSLCGRFVGDISSRPMTTPVGFACPTCVRVWNKHMDAHNARTGATDEKYLADLADEFDLLIGSGDPAALITRWSELGGNPAAQHAVRERLDERDVDIAAALEQAGALAEAAGKS